MGTLSVGILILVGGSQRFGGVSFATARQVAPWWVWGMAMTFSGTLALLGAVGHWMWLSRIGHSLSSVVYLFLVTTFVDAVLKSHQAALTGIGVYTAFALMHAFAAASADLEKQTHDANIATKEAEKAWKDAGTKPLIVLPQDEPVVEPRAGRDGPAGDPLAGKDVPWRRPFGNAAGERKDDPR